MEIHNFTKLTQEIDQQEWGAMHSVLVYAKKQLVYEAYFQGFSREMLHEAQSVTKSLQSILVGIAYDQGALKDLDQPIYPYFEDFPEITWDTARKQITLRHLLTMTAGLSWNESSIPYTDIFTNDSNILIMHEDWISYALQKPMQHAPGSVFAYSSAAPILMSHILYKSTGLPNEEFAKKFLFEPLGIHHFVYQKNPSYTHLLADIDVRPADLAKIGLLMLQNGQWEGQKIFAADWVELSTQNHRMTNDSEEGYGFWWWRKTMQVHQQPISMYYAWGYGGQHIFVIPALEAVVVFAGGFYEITLAQEPFLVLENFILPALV